MHSSGISVKSTKISFSQEAHLVLNHNLTQILYRINLLLLYFNTRPTYINIPLHRLKLIAMRVHILCVCTNRLGDCRRVHNTLGVHCTTWCAQMFQLLFYARLKI